MTDIIASQGQFLKLMELVHEGERSQSVTGIGRLHPALLALLTKPYSLGPSGYDQERKRKYQPLGLARCDNRQTASRLPFGASRP
jgi:hypothetical protein